MNVYAKNTATIVCAAAAASLIAVTVAVISSQPVSATPAYASATGKACGFCHQNPAGGGALKPAGEKFKANGHKL